MVAAYAYQNRSEAHIGTLIEAITTNEGLEYAKSDSTLQAQVKRICSWPDIVLALADTQLLSGKYENWLHGGLQTLCFFYALQRYRVPKVSIS